jgi:hypothetical protein
VAVVRAEPQSIGRRKDEALQRYLALPSTGPLKTIAAWKA